MECQDLTTKVTKEHKGREKQFSFVILGVLRGEKGIIYHCGVKINANL
jgi:hypothetical protein